MNEAEVEHLRSIIRQRNGTIGALVRILRDMQRTFEQFDGLFPEHRAFCEVCRTEGVAALMTARCGRGGCPLGGVPAAAPEPHCRYCASTDPAHHEDDHRREVCPTCGSTDRAVRNQAATRSMDDFREHGTTMPCADPWHGGETPS